MTDQPIPVPPSTPPPVLTRKKMLGLTLFLIGHALPILDISFETGEWVIWEFVSLPDIFAIAFLMSVVGLALYAKASGKPAAAAFLCVFPYIGPFLFIATTELESLSTRNSTGMFARNLTSTGVKTLAAFIGLVLLFYAVSINYFRFHNHRGYGEWLMHHEAKAALTQICEAEKAYYARYHRYGNFDEIGFNLPENNNRYTYRIDESGKAGTIIKSSRSDPSRCERHVPVRASFSETHFTATAWGYTSSDNALHAWHINELGQGLEKPDIDGDVQYAEKLDIDCAAQPR